MVSFNTLLMLVFYYFLPLVTAISIPMPMTQSISPNSIAPFNSLNRPVPDTPEGFRAKFEFNRSRQLGSPVLVYAEAIQAMSDWSYFGWNSPMTNSRAATGPGLHGICIVYSGSVPGETPPKLSYILLGLYQGILEMIRQNSFYELSITLWFHWHIVGIVLITNPPYQNLGGGSVINGTLQGITTNSTLNANSGRIIDPTQPWWVINWNFNGALIDSTQLFTAMLDALITAASHETQEDCLEIHGISLAGDTAIQFYDTRNPDPRAPRLTYGLVTAALPLMVKHIFLRNSKLAEVEFNVSCDRLRFAAGSVMKLETAPGNGTLGMATER